MCGAGAGLLKTRGLTISPFYFFKGLSHLHLEIILLFGKLCYTFVPPQFYGHVILKLSKNEFVYKFTEGW